jgi:excisionase family DNA binding protein
VIDLADLIAEDLACLGLHRADEWSFRAIEREIAAGKALAAPPMVAESPRIEASAATPPPPGHLPLLVTPQLAAEVLGVTESQLRLLLHEGRIARVRIGKRDLIPRDAIEGFIHSNTVQPKSWRDETPAPSSASSASAAATTSLGQKAVARASAQRALRTANKLKSLSPAGSTSEPATSAGRVIPLKP